jgi:large subunit ribosomal protein L16
MTKKPAEVRMGKGKGSKVYNEIYPIRPGKIIFELRRIRASSAIFYLNLIASKLSVATRVVKLKE